jgi:membrane protease YdiL (CAAX protease family)
VAQRASKVATIIGFITDHRYFVATFYITIIISTLLDLIRVPLFNRDADIGFLILTIILQSVLIFKIMSVYLFKSESLLGHLRRETTLPEILFLICNFFSSCLTTNFVVFILANYFKIVNAMRVNDILRYLQQRWRLKMIKKYIV